MASRRQDPFSYDLTALADYEPDDQYQSVTPATVGVGSGRLDTPPSRASSGIGVGSHSPSPSILTNVTVGVGGTPVRRSPKGKQPAKRATRGGKEPRRAPRQNTPPSPSDAGSLRRSSAGDSGGSRRGSGGSRRSGSGGGRGGRGGGGGGSGGGGGGSGGGGGGDDGDDDDGDDDDGDDTPPGVPGPSRGRARRRILNDQEMEQQLAQILQDQRQMAAGRRIAGITTTNTITTTYKNGRRPTVTRRSTSVRN